MTPQNVTSIEAPKPSIKDRILKHKTALAFTAGATGAAILAVAASAYKNKSDDLSEAESEIDDLTAIMDAVSEKEIPAEA